MKITCARKIHYDNGPNMTPLVDIVMVILIFLMLAGTFAGAEHFLVSNVSTGCGPAKDSLMVRVDWADGHIVARVGGAVLTDREALVRALGEKAKGYESIGEKLPDVPVLIQSARSVPYRYVIEAYDAAQEARFQTIMFSAGK